jgi:transposase
VKRFQAWHPEQPYLLPPDPREWLPDGHPAFLVHDLVARLDLSEIVNAYGDGSTGGMPPFDPRMMTRVWLYAYLHGVRSSRKVARALVEDVALRFLSGNQQPKYWALNAFRTRHRLALANLFSQSIELAARAGLVPLEHVAIDGTKLKANASKSKAMSYARLTAEQQRLRAEIEAYLDACDDADAAEDEAFGDDDGLGVPAHLRDRKARLEAIERAKEQLEREAKERAEREQNERREASLAQGKEFRPRVDPQAELPRTREQRNSTDPESHIMRRHHPARPRAHLNPHHPAQTPSASARRRQTEQNAYTHRQLGAAHGRRSAPRPPLSSGRPPPPRSGGPSDRARRPPTAARRPIRPGRRRAARRRPRGGRRARPRPDGPASAPRTRGRGAAPSTGAATPASR